MSTIEWPSEVPAVSVWAHIQTGIDWAEEELDWLPEDLTKLTRELGVALLELRARLVLDDQRTVDVDEFLLEEPWVRYAADLHVAEEGVERARVGIDRYGVLRPSLAARKLPDKPLRYAREVLWTYIFGFDPAAIALSRAALEQVLKDTLVRTDVYTAGRLRREKPTAGVLLENAKRAGLLRDAYDAAKRVVERGDTLMHSHIYEPKVLRQMAADSLADLTEAIVELMGGT